MSLKKATLIGVIWNFLEQLSKKGIGVALTLVLALFLTPEDYGLIAMMAVFIAIGNSLMESGFRDALIRLDTLGKDDLNTAFYSNVILGLIAYILIFVLAPSIASFYEQERLVELIRVLALTIVINSFQIIQLASLSRKLNFKAQVKSSLPASFLSALIAVYLAYAGYGVWALIWQMVFQSLIHTMLLWWYERWRPKRNFSVDAFKSLYRFGYKLFLAGLLNISFKNMYIVVIAKLFSATTAGLYFFAERIKTLLIQQLVSSIQTVTFPALAKFQNDDVKLKHAYKNIIQITCMIVYPSMMLLIVIAPAIFDAFFPERWEGVVIYLQIFCVIGMLYPFHSINLNIVKVKGRSDLFLGLEVVKKIISVSILFMTFSFGIFAIMGGQVISSLLACIANSYYSSKLIGYSILEQIKDLILIFLSSLIASVTGWILLSLVNISNYLVIFILTPLILVMYFVILFFLDRRPILELMSLIKSKTTLAN